MKKKPNIRDVSIGMMTDLVKELGHPRFRAVQVIKWLYQKRITSFEQMVNTPKDFRKTLADRFSVEPLRPLHTVRSEAEDAVKFAFPVEPSGELIEAVLLYDGKRRTACVSSQLGCGLGCRFCETGRLGFVRNLKLHEIIGQLAAINDYLASYEDKRITNIVFMGMGEALLNYNRFKQACEIVTSSDGLNLAPKRITVSTAGLVPGIRKLSRDRLGVGLAVSLNTYSDEKRDRIMPINRRYPIKAVLEAAHEYARILEDGITFEYVVIEGENDGDDAVESLVRYLGRIPCKVNLIPLNPTTGEMGIGPEETRLRRFAEKLYAHGVIATVRKSRGRDIDGACGQLAGRLRNRNG